jgi:hypothetical protein
MDLNDVEKIDFAALGGADNVVVNDLSGTDVTELAIDLGAPGNVGDGAADTVTINGTSGDDVIQVFLDGTTLTVFGLAEQVVIRNFEAALDHLVINGPGGRRRHHRDGRARAGRNRGATAATATTS